MPKNISNTQRIIEIHEGMGEFKQFMKSQEKRQDKLEEKIDQLPCAALRLDLETHKRSILAHPGLLLKFWNLLNGKKN